MMITEEEQEITQSPQENLKNMKKVDQVVRFISKNTKAMIEQHLLDQHCHTSNKKLATKVIKEKLNT